MLRFLPLLLILALTLYALIDCLSRDEEEIRSLPRLLWVLIILLFAPIGPVAWFIAGRPRGASTRRRGPRATGTDEVVGGYSMGSTGGPGRTGRPVAPDDDPEFLRRLDEKRRRERDETPEAPE